MNRKGSLQKGNRIERDFMEKLKAMGYVCDRAERSMRMIPDFKRPSCPTCHRHFTFTMSKKHDTFGCFDIIAKNTAAKEFTFYFQVATRWKYGEDKENMQNFPAGDLDIVCMVRKEDRKPYEVRWWHNREWREMSCREFFEVKPYAGGIPKFTVSPDDYLVK